MTELGKFEIALASDELTLSASVTPRHRSLLASYRMNAHRGEASARNLIIRDLRSFLDLGAIDRATDLLIVLALFMREAARCERRLLFASRRHRDAIALQRGRAAARAHYAIGKTRGEHAPTLRLVTPDDLTTTIEGEEKI
ncbi:hypothetical protein ACNHKD_16270 [Methylocystis sp. JAN1]|uniref:hypothetical protein n=1 Tax=Methylocystis sp. JAN1 TaxID=3397211 RepID=UPI003FA2D5AA